LPKICNRLSRVHERYRQTDGRTTTYSEHEHEFTFAKNTRQFVCLQLVTYLFYSAPAGTVAGWQRACVRGNNNERWRRIVFVVAEFRGRLLTITEIQLQVLEYYPCTTKFTKIGTLVAENYDIVAYGYATVDERYFAADEQFVCLFVVSDAAAE